jgi:hypothetical protein
VKHHGKYILTVICGISLFLYAAIKTSGPATNTYDGAHQWLTASTVKYVNNWLHDGAVKDHFLLYEDAVSIEFEQYNRSIYTSYPPGAVLPVYLAARIAGRREITPLFVKQFVRAEYILSSIVLGCFFYLLLVLLRFASTSEKIVLPILFSAAWIFLPFNYYYLQHVYFTDQAVIVLSILFFTNELLLLSIKDKNRKRIFYVLSFSIVLAGVLTDYYFVTIVLTAIVIRFFLRSNNVDDKRAGFLTTLTASLDLLLPVLLGYTLFVIQLSSVPEGFQMLKNKFLERTAMSADTASLRFTVWQGLSYLAGHFADAFGKSVFVIIPAEILLTVYLFKKNIQQKEIRLLIAVLSLIFFAAVLHTILLMNHSVIHEFSMLKYSLVFLQLLFTLYCIIRIIRPVLFRQLPSHITVIVFLVAISAWFFKLTWRSAKEFTSSHTSADLVQYREIDQYIFTNSTCYDVLFSPDIVIDPNPPYDISIARKRVYRISQPEELITRPLPATAVINLIIAEKTARGEKWRWTDTLPKKRISAGYTIIRVNRHTLELLLHTM